MKTEEQDWKGTNWRKIDEKLRQTHKKKIRGGNPRYLFGMWSRRET